MTYKKLKYVVRRRLWNRKNVQKALMALNTSYAKKLKFIGKLKVRKEMKVSHVEKYEEKYRQYSKASDDEKSKYLATSWDGFEPNYQNKDFH